MNVWWVYATDDNRQHGSTTMPPNQGGTFRALCEHHYTAPPGRENNYRVQGVKPFCDRCLMEYCLVQFPAPLWTY